MLASACTGVLLLAETGLLDGREATIHWAFAPTFHRNFPRVKLRTEEVLITAGDRRELVMTGGVMSWHDLALHLIARHVGPTAAQAMARLLMLEWHAEGQAPYIELTPRLDHGDAPIAELQRWLADHYMVADPVDEMVARTGLARRTLERRFRKATGHSPLRYVQDLRIAEAAAGWSAPTRPSRRSASRWATRTPPFRRVFKRTTRLTPGAYRRKFRSSFRAPGAGAPGPSPERARQPEVSRLHSLRADRLVTRTTNPRGGTMATPTETPTAVKADTTTETPAPGCSATWRGRSASAWTAGPRSASPSGCGRRTRPCGRRSRFRTS